jgi:hypothetical protein
MVSNSTLPQSESPFASVFNKIVLGLLGLVLLVRLSFLGAGAMTFPDEYRYYASIDAVYGLFPISHGGFAKFNAGIQRTQGRPGDALLRTVPAGLQLQLEKMTGINLHSQESLLIPILFNYFITLGSLYLFYRIAQLLLRNQPAALLSTVVYSCLVNTNLYIRHILPYDTGMLCVFGTFFLCLRMKQQPFRRTWPARFAIGALAGLTFAVYPGYNAVIVVAGLLLLEKRIFTDADWKSLFRTGLPYGFGVLAVLGFFQLLSLANGTSYYEDCLTLSDTIKQGDYADGVMFLPKYLFQAEQSLGYLLAGLIVVAVPVLFFRLRTGFTPSRLFALISDNLMVIAMVLAFVWHVVMVYYFEKMVFYGRLLHLYIPFFVLLVIKVLYPFTRRNIQYVAAAAVGGVALYSFAVFALQYHRIVYPLTFLHQHANDYPGAKVTTREQAATADNADYFIPLNGFSQHPATPGQAEVVLVNMGFLYPITDNNWCNEIKLPASFKLTYSAPHFLNLRAYPFEGYTMAERDILLRCQYQCQVYEQR